jgi:hypothetical protein
MRSAPTAGQAAHADQAARCKRKKRLSGRLGSTDQLGFAQATHGFEPIKAFLDPLAVPLTDSVALMASGATIYRTTPAWISDAVMAHTTTPMNATTTRDGKSGVLICATGQELTEAWSGGSSAVSKCETPAVLA